jgi:hypothetical protein
MDVVSLGCRTDLALLQLGGTQLEDRGDHLVVRSPHNPGHWWGNFLLLEAAPAPEDAGPVGRAARRRLPGHAPPDARLRRHERHGRRPQRLRPARARRGSADRDDRDLRDLGRPAPRCRVPLAGERGRLAAVRRAAGALQRPGGPGPAPAVRRGAGADQRGLVEAGHGGWFGAFADGRLACQMGLFAASPGLARFQSVETDPDFRRRGIARRWCSTSAATASTSCRRTPW